MSNKNCNKCNILMLFLFLLCATMNGCFHKNSSQMDESIDYSSLPNSWKDVLYADGFIYMAPHGALVSSPSESPHLTEMSIGQYPEETHVTTNEFGIIKTIDHYYYGTLSYSYNLDSIINEWTAYHRFTTVSGPNFRETKSEFDYFMRNGIPYFEGLTFYKPDGTVFNGEIISSWSSQCSPPTNGKSKITFNNGLLWQIAEARPDGSIAYVFDMGKLIYLFNTNGTFLERHVEPGDSNTMYDFCFCTDSKCFFYHPLETINRCWYFGPPHY